MKIIEKLTPEQEARLPEWRDKWTAIGLSCEPLDFPRAKNSVILAYASARLEPPKLWVQCDGPLSAAIVAAILRDNAWDSVGDSVRDSVGDSVWDSVGDSVWDSVRASVNHMAFGPHDANWIAFVDFFRVVLGLWSICQPLEALTDLTQCCGWWAPYRGAAILQHRHSELHRDDRGALHNERGMAVKYRDGWGVYAWHGVRVPADVIESPDKITAERVRAESSEEVRRVMIERFGWERWLKEEKAKVVHTRFNERDGQWERLHRLKDGTQRIVLTDPSTGRRYALGVPREIENCEQAQGWLSHGLDRFAIHRS